MSVRIAHLSDTQIRNFKRHWEFRQSYENLYRSLKEKKPNAIVLVGDIAHTKTQISPEFVDMCVDYFKNLADIAPLHIIPGNHDGNLNNLTRMDALSPLVKALHHPNIFYYKNSGIRPLFTIPPTEDFRLAVYSCFDENWPKKEELDERPWAVNVGLFHGMIQGAVLQNGFPVDDSPYELRQFLDSVDYLMLGDIHKHQFLDAKKRSGYCGSYPQQNYGETVEKGYLLWDIESKDKHNVEFVQLPNVCPFYTLALQPDLVVPTDLPFQKKARIRVFCRELTVFEKKTTADKIYSLYDPYDLIFLDESNIQRQEVKLLSLNEKLENLDDLNVQEKLLREFLEPQNLSDDQLKRIFEINKLYNVKAREKDDIFRNVQYKLGKMTFHNTFSFGENNEFDFSRHKGILGVFGKNAVGKSSLAVDIPLYTIFNRISKDGVVKNDLIINEDKEDCASEIEIMVGREKHVITRATHVYVKSGKKDGDPVVQGKTDVSYKVFKEDGTEEDQTAEKRQDTDQVIRQKFGTIEDFVSTSMAPQWQLLGIINAKATERLKLIGRYFDIDIFSQKHKMANDDWKGIKGQLKLYERRNFEEELSLSRESMEEINIALKESESRKSALQIKVEEYTKKIDEFRSKIVNVNVSKFDESEINAVIAGKKLDIKDWERQIEESRALTLKKNGIDIDSLTKKRDRWEKIKEYERHAAALENGCGCKHQEDCSIHKKIQEYREQIAFLKNTLDISQKEVQNQIAEWNKINPRDLSGLLKCVKSDKDELASLEQQKQDMEKNKEQIKTNFVLQEEIDDQKNLQYACQISVSKVLNEIVGYARSLGNETAKEEEILNSKEEYETIRRDYDVYSYFITAMSKDGIAKQIISDNLSIINLEIEKILSKGVGFGIEIESAEEGDGKAIEIYFKHESSKKRRIELCSGMEKTIAAIALRAALINVTTLPRSNVFVLDEVFTALDPEYMDAVSKILEYLKQLFDSVVIITHIDAFKDIVDHVVEIERDDEGFSRICG